MGYSIAVFGAFNVSSFGDSMFPKALYNELSKRMDIDNFAIFSPGGRKIDYNDNQKVYDYDEFPVVYEKHKFDAIIIGGGELLHNAPITFENGKIVYKSGELWKKPIEYGKQYNIKVVLNSVGMPYEFQEKDREEYEDLFDTIDYVSLRDTFSYERYIHFFGEASNVKLVPDSLWLLNNYFSPDTLKESFLNLKNRYGIQKDFIVFQYGTTKNCKEALNTVKLFADAAGLQVVGIAINGSHEDVLVVDQIADEEIVAIKSMLNPTEITSLISNAAMFVGTSMHGNLTAAAFGVKNVIVDMYPNFVSKMDGFAKSLDRDDNFVNETSDLLYVLQKTYSTDNKVYVETIKKLKLHTRKHYDTIAAVINGKETFYKKAHAEIVSNSDAELFKKAYFKVSSPDGIKCISKTIAKNNNNVFTFSIDIPEIEDSDIAEFVVPINAPAKIAVDESERWIQYGNDVSDNVYIDPLVKWRLYNRKEYDLSCTFLPVPAEEIAEKMLCAYTQKIMHIEQLCYKERNYVRLLEKSDAIINSQKNCIADKTEQINQYSVQVEELKTKAKQKEEYILSLTRKQQDMHQQIIDLKQEVLNKEGHIQLLLPSEREYKKIINSKMFKIMRFCCRTFDIVMFIPKTVVKKGIAFIRLLSHVNVPKLKIAWGYVKEEGIQDAYRHLMRDYHQGELKQIQVNVEEKIYDDITSIQECAVLNLPKTETPMVSIVIPAYNQFTYTYYCIKSIIENSGDIEYEVILADDCSNDLTRQITSVVKNLIVAKTEKNLLFLRNCNNAAKQAKGKYILFLNNDTQVQKDWLRPLVDLCERDRAIGLVGSKLVYADGTLQEAGGIIWKDGSGWNYGRNDDAMKPEYNYVREVDYLSGASIMIRRSLWEELGGFDEHFAPAYCEDSDLAFQVRKAGYRVVYQPLSVVVHFEGKSNGTDVTSGVKKYQVENSLKLQQKWKEEFQKQEANGQKVFKARERSLNKKIVLVIDHYVPHYDKDAGSKTTFQYLKMFVQQGYSVKFMGDNFCQHEPYTTVLQQMGIEVLYGPWYAQHWQEWILANKNYIDFAYLNRPHITMKYIDFLKENTNIKCIYYGHDLHFLRLRREYELTGDAKKLEESQEWLEKELYIMRKADISYYPSYVEEQEIHKIDTAIPVKAITAYVYEEFLTDIAMDFTKREGIMFVGGFGHPPNEDAVIWFVENVYPLIEKQQDIPFYIVGSNPTERIKKLQRKNIIVKGFVSEEELRELYNTCKVVVVPLRYGAGVKGKVVEALYYGTPMVTTSVGVEGIEGAEAIIEVADTSEKFAEDVLTLYNDNAVLVEKVQKYQKFVKDKFGIEAVWNIIEGDFR